MRFHELLESVGKYRPMFSVFATDGVVPAWVDESIRRFEGIFKREDRVVWALRWYRVWQAAEFRLYEPEHADAWRKVIKGLPNMDAEALRFHSEVFMGEIEAFKHFFSLPVAKIEKFVFGNQTPAQITEAFRDLEEEWQATRRQIVNHKDVYGKVEDEDQDSDEDEDDEDYDEEESNYNYTEYDSWSGRERRKKPVHGDPYIIVDFHNGWAWWDLNRAFCHAEGNAMGHCGNAASPGEDDHVLSLRRHMGGDEYRPSCTFILNKNGMLGEMKGRANEKPKAEYHDMIVSLLMSPMVKGVVGGGYESSKNFSVLDLPEEMRDALLEKKPSLLSPGEAYTVFNQAMTKSDLDNLGPDHDQEQAEQKALANFEARMREYLKSYGLSFKSMRLFDGAPYAILSEYNSIEATYSNSVEMLTDFFSLDELGPAFQKFDHELNDDDAEVLVNESKAMNFFPAAKVCLEELADDEFELEGVGYKVLHGGKVLLCISGYNLCHPVGRNDPDDYDTDPGRERFVYDRINNLSADLENEVHSRDSKEVLENLDLKPSDYEDFDAVEALIAYVVDVYPAARFAAQRACFDAVADPERTVFSRDPRQLNLFGDQE